MENKTFEERLFAYEFAINLSRDTGLKCGIFEDLKDARNELCLQCGKYKERHKGACNGCRWL